MSTPQEGIPVTIKKIKRIKRKKISNLEGYRLLDINLLESMVASLSCPECFENNLYLEEDETKKGSCFLYIYCMSYVKVGYTSKIAVDESHTAKKGMKPFEINARIVYALCTCGLGYAAVETLCCIMNMPKPMRVANFDKITNKIRDSAKVVAEISMNNDAAELKKGSQGIVDIGVTVDGTGQRRGYTSMNGVVVAMSIDSGKILDIEPLSRYCKSCNTMSRTLENNPQMFEEWKKIHQESCKSIILVLLQLWKSKERRECLSALLSKEIYDILHIMVMEIARCMKL